MRVLVLSISILMLLGCTNTVAKKTTKEVVTKKVFPEIKPDRYNVAFLIMDGTFNTELTAPFDIFQHTIFRKGIKPMNVFTVADTDKPITTFEGMRILPDFNYLKDSLPKIDILVVPSAEHHLDTDLENEALINFVKKVDKEAQFVTSHCDGAFVLAKAGVLNGKVSTTFPSDIEKMRAMFPNLDIMSEVLFVHDGKYITSAGGAKSFEAALYLCEYLYGKEIAKSLAGGLVIDWDVDKVPHIILND
ncbi:MULTISPECIES: DJ-1/PfpI family protein [Tenacibaculum]|uniref:Glutamine amidotransferase n=1 Tax=Tenacibaculum aiptasiae TaxID=426481 RepID=A0A7J5AEC6_9FLAO|nr:MULTISPECIES: DJ-1/PfpI family protein [Tenacibaculum]KAB1155399.1 glutamine amidotransferase [Tenacibaculum aiptasiae]MCF2873493.1 DJ-1/PfpI family protein [Tenacibaculum sp. Cn5-1]MCF2933649.1 DJ-1/PfpI family protein [Tenacibaculum sp. Cn5-34]MCG7509769.1 DJ-1/PfpI family protein [Tenacibaculum sp. Cn5-46]